MKGEPNPLTIHTVESLTKIFIDELMHTHTDVATMTWINASIAGYD